MAQLKKSLRCELVRGKHGVLDYKASLAQIQEALEDLRLAETISDEERTVISAAVDQFLAVNAAPGFKLPDVAQIVCFRHLKVEDKHLESTQAKIKSVIRNDVDRFYIAKGKNGGLRVVSRMTKEEHEAWKKHREEQEALAQAEANAEASETATA